MKKLPKGIANKAYISPGAHEFAWKRADLNEALKAISESEQAILGGEVWLVKDISENWWGLIPSKDGSPPAAWSWDTTSRKPNENWADYCENTYQESLKAVAGLYVENEASPEIVSYIWFNVTFIEESEA